MKTATTLLIVLALIGFQSVTAQTTEYHFSPERTGELTDAFPVYEQNGARGISGPYDMDRDGKVEVLVSQHDAAGGTVHVIEHQGGSTWEHVYSTALIDPSSSSSNTRYAIAGDLDGDGNWEIITTAGVGYDQSVTAWPSGGVYVWEHDGVVGSDNYGSRPATAVDFYALDGRSSASFYAQILDIADLDGDGDQELLVPANGPSANDVFYVLSVTGDFEMDGYGNTFETWNVEATEAPRERAIGGGSAYAAYAGDFNGDGNMDVSWHSWNSFNFFNGTWNAGVYEPAPDGGNLQASAGIGDHVSLFGGVVADIDGDGNDEVFYTNFMSGALSVMDYNSTESVTIVDANHFAFDAIPVGATGGATAGDSDGDGQMEIMVGGPGYGLSARNNNEPSFFIHNAEFLGGDPKDGTNWDITPVNTSSPLDTLGFNVVYRDSAGVATMYREVAASKQGSTGSGSDPVFPSMIAYLGDVNGDGNGHIALSFQGIDDSLAVYDEVWNADSLRYERSVREIMANPERAFVRIISMSGTSVATQDRIVLPSDYQLDQNYPNPFNPTTNIRFTLPVDKAVSVRVYDVQGRLVKTLVDNRLLAQGVHEVVWDGTSNSGAQAASGTYLYTLEYGNFRQSKTMVLLK
ncbi:MAG: FG-GAP-like repeat-containing protein [Rhodothermales bacterium]